MKRKILLTAMLMLVSLLFTACGEAEIKYSDKAEQLKLNMSYDEVKNIFGEEGELISDSELGDESHVMMYTWSNKRNKDDTLSCLFIISPAGTTSYLRGKDVESSNLIKTVDTLNNLLQVQDGVLNVKPDDFVSAFNVLLADADKFKTMGAPSNNIYMYEMGKIGLALGVNADTALKDITVIGDLDDEYFRPVVGMLIHFLVNCDLELGAKIGGDIGLYDESGQGGNALYQKILYGYRIEDDGKIFYANFEVANK